MPVDHDTPHPDSTGLTRREFIVRSTLVAGAITLGDPLRLFAEPPAGLASASASASAIANVVEVCSANIVTPRGLHEGVLLDVLHLMLQRLTGLEPADAWRALLRADDVIGLKFNQSGADGLGTTDVMLRVLVQSLTSAGFDPKRMVGIEVSAAIRAETGVQAPVEGWSDQPADFGSGRDQLAAWLDQVTAIINVPFLKTHNIAGVTCCLKNLSHAVVKHPAQFHGNGCSPFIGDIVALPQVREKLRLHLVNALRVVFDGGPSAVEDCIWDAGMLLGGYDPVAVDCVGLQMIDRVRGALKLPLIAGGKGPPAYLGRAAERGVGTDRLHLVRLIKASV